MARSKRPRETPPAPDFAPEALDALIGETRTPEELEALFRQMKKRIVERMLGAELTHHLGPIRNSVCEAILLLEEELWPDPSDRGRPRPSPTSRPRRWTP